MQLIKLYEQWLAEEDKPMAEPKPAEPSKGAYSISVTPDNGQPFELLADGESSEDTKEVRNFKVVDPKTSNSSIDSTVMVSKKNDKDGNFDIVIAKDPTKPETAQIYSGKVTISKA